MTSIRNKARWIARIVWVLLMVHGADGRGASIISYPNPPSFIPRAAEFTVSAGSTNIYVYNAGVFRCASFAFSGTIVVQVAYSGTITNYQINPLSAGITASKSGNTLTFTLSQPQKLEVQVNGAQDMGHNAAQLLYLFADAPETNAPSPSDPAVIYFAAGSNNVVGVNSTNFLAKDFINGNYVSIDGKVDTQSRTLYLAPGAVLNAAVSLNKLNNFTVCGRGMIYYPFAKTNGAPNLFYVGSCTNLLVRDIQLFNSQWQVISFHASQGSDTACYNNTISNVKSLHTAGNSDAVSFFGRANHIIINNCFLISNDNLIVLGGAGSSEPIGPHDNTIQNCSFVKSSSAGNWFFPQGNSGGNGGNIGPNNVITNCDVIRVNSDAAGLIAGNFGSPTDFSSIQLLNNRVQSLDNPSYKSTYPINFININYAGATNYNRCFAFKGLYLPAANTSFISSGNYSFTFDHVYANGVAATSDNDLNLTKMPGVCTLYLYDLSLGKPVTTDSQQIGSPATSGNDGDPTTAWLANDTQSNHWWKVDLGSGKQITGADVMWPQSGTFQYKIEVSLDGTNWGLAMDNTPNAATNQIQGVSFLATARFVRLTVTGFPAGARAGLLEFTVFGYDNISENYPMMSDTQLGTNAAGNGNDGNPATYWSASDTNVNHWLCVDLGFPTAQITGCEMVWPAAMNYKYMVEISGDNTNWVLALDRRQNTATNQIQSAFFNAVGRYARITVTGLPAGAHAAVNEFSVFGYENLSAGQAATADSQSATNPAANGNDWDTTTSWMVGDTNTNHWWMTDLGARHYITGTEVIWPFAKTYKYRIEISDDAINWQAVLDKTNTTNTNQVQDDVFFGAGRYVRITLTGLPPGCAAGFYEFKVFGVPSPIMPFSPVTGTANGQFAPTVVFSQTNLLLPPYSPSPAPVLTVVSPHGIPTPSGITTNPFNAWIQASVQSPVVSGTTQYMATGWIGTGSVGTGTGTTVSFYHTNNTTLTWQWQTNVWLNLKTLGN